jgi:hypothetical protein
MFVGRAQAAGLRFSANSQRFHPRRHPARLTIRSSRRRISASLKLAGVRAILAPDCRVRRGLTQALGGEKRLVVGCSSRKFFDSGWQALRLVHRLVSSSVVARCALTGRMRCACWLRRQWSLPDALPAPDAVASVTAGSKFVGRAQAAGLRFSANSQRFHPRRHPARLTSHSSRRRLVASLKSCSI